MVKTSYYNVDSNIDLHQYYQTSDEEEYDVFYCPFCGAKEEELTGHIYYDRIHRRYVCDMFCNKCKRAFIVIPIPEESEVHKNQNGGM
ncbi:MAG: hypothetical protein ACTSV7_06810 [Candidatus Baldrarchaeia archaeon]